MIAILITFLLGCGNEPDPEMKLALDDGTITSDFDVADTWDPPSGSVLINNGDATTSKIAVTLNLSAIDTVHVSGYFLSETNSTPSATASGWVTIANTQNYVASVDFTLLIPGAVGENLRTVYAWYKDSAGNVSVVSSDSITLVAEGNSPTVSSTSPADSATSVSRSSTITVTFSEAISTASVTTNTSDTACSGTLRVSSDSFSTCVQMSSSPTVSNSSQAFTVTPSSNLSVLTTYKIRVTTGVKDSNDNTLSSQYETSNGFTTGTPPTVSSTSPADSDTSVSLNRIIAVTFSEAMDSASVTTNTSGTTCSGTLQVSSDSFSTCIQMSSFPTVSNSYQTFTVTSSSNLSVSTAYKIRVTTGVEDSSGNTLSSQFETSNGFTTIVDDATPPTFTSIAIRWKSVLSYASCCVSLQLSAQDDVGVTAFYISGSNSSPNIDSNVPISLQPNLVPEINLNTWYSVKNVTTNLSQKVYTNDGQWRQVTGYNTGTYNIYAWFRDAEGSVSQVSTDSITCNLSNCY